MFSKAKRFEPLAPGSTKKCQSQNKPTKPENEKQKVNTKAASTAVKPKPFVILTSSKIHSDVQSQCSSVHSVRSFATPKPLKTTCTIKAPSSLKKKNDQTNSKIKNETEKELIKSQEVEIRNKDHTIAEYTKQIEEFKQTIAQLEKEVKEMRQNNLNHLDRQFSQITIEDLELQQDQIETVVQNGDNYLINQMNNKIYELEKQCQKLEQEVTDKQLALRSVEEIITIRDSLCQDLQLKLTKAETDLEETIQRLEMVKGHHALALEANESIRREYKVELETLKSKLEEEKQTIINKSKSDQENLKSNYKSLMGISL